HMVVGANYPWVRCGHDFGGSIWHDGRRTRALNWRGLSRQFRYLRRIGIRVLRWWILAGGVNYPNTRTERDRVFERVRAGSWQFLRLRAGQSLPRLGSDFLDD